MPRKASCVNLYSSGMTKSPSDGPGNKVPQTICAGAPTQILLQTARLGLTDSRGYGFETVARAVLNSGGQKTYVSSQLRGKPRLPTVRTEKIRIKSTESSDKSYDVVHLDIQVKEFSR